jgi:hypothetical protein
MTIQPATHAVLIGVGDYSALASSVVPSVRALGLESLSSPPVSAMALAEWLLGRERFAGAGRRSALPRACCA